MTIMNSHILWFDQTRMTDVHLVGGNRVFHGPRYGAEGGLVEYQVDALAGLAAGFRVADVALDEGEVSPLGFGDQRLDLVEVVLVAGGEVIEADHHLVQFQQCLQEVRTYEAGGTGD